MRNVILSLVVVAVLVAGGLGGTFAGFVDTEISEGNRIQAGMTDLLINGKNDPIGPKIRYTHVVPCKSIDFWVDALNWGECQGGWLYMHYKDVVSEEAGKKLHFGKYYVYDGVAPGNATLGVPFGYREATGVEPKGPNVWSTEPEKIAEVGDGMVDQVYIPDDHPCLLGEDYASGIADHLGVTTTVPLVGQTGDLLGNPDTNGDGTVDAAERAAWVTAGNRWEIIDSLTGKLVDIECNKDYLGFLPTQQMTFIHIDVHLQQLECPDWPDPQTRWWPSNALQGDWAEWDMMWELITDDPPEGEELP